MAVRIGHASTDSPSSGKASDQVRIGDYYNGGWYVVLRPTNLKLAIRSAEICETCCNKNDSGKMILYSQSKRNSLKQEALKAAGFLASEDEMLAQITPGTIESITATCYADCSSFMTFCATCAGARFNYAYWETNAPTCNVMKKYFTSKGDYLALTSDKYINSSDYLQRGDILVCSGHTVMVLDNGSKAAALDYSDIDFDSVDATSLANTAYVDITSFKLTTSIISITQSALSVSLDVTKLEDGVEKALKKADMLSAYTWKYTLTALAGAEKSTRSDTLKIVAASTSLEFTGLTPDTTYIFRVFAEKTSEKIKLQSASMIFTTLKIYPSAVQDLKISCDVRESIKSKFTVKFTQPSNWGQITATKCYRLLLIVNGKQIAYSDTLIAATGANKNKSFYINQLIQDSKLIRSSDVVQIGILPGIKDSTGTFIADNGALRCSTPIVLNKSVLEVNKTFINIENIFKRVVLHNNT